MTALALGSAASLQWNTLQGIALQTDAANTDLMIAGAVIGLLIGGPLVIFAFTGQHRWLAILALSACYLVAFRVGGWEAAIAAVFTSVFAIVVSAALLRHIFDESTWEAFRYQIELALGRNKGIQIIEDGRTVVPKDGGQLYGPRTIVVKPNNAVILERGSQQTRISGPAVFKSEPFEYVRRIIELRPRQDRLTVDGVLTRDGLGVDVILQVTVGIDIPEELRLGRRQFGQTEIAAIRDIDLRTTQWQSVAMSIVESSVRQLVGAVDFQDLRRPSVFRRLERQIRLLSNDRCRDWHLRVIETVLERVQPTSETVAYINEKIQAAALKDALGTMAEGYQTARSRGVPEDAIQREIQRHTLEHVSKDSKTEVFLSS